MKKKFRVFANIAMLALCVCAIAVGVYSAKQATLNATGSIGFNAHNCDVDVTATIVGHSKTEHGVPETVPQALSIATDDTNTHLVDNAFQIRGKNAKLSFGSVFFSDMGESGEPEDIVIELTITNKSQFNVLVDDLTVNASDNANISVDCYKNLAVLYTEAGKNTTTVTYTLSLKPNEQGNYDNIPTTALADINLNLKLSKLPEVTREQKALFEFTSPAGAGAGVTITKVPTLAQWTEAGGDENTLIIPSSVYSTTNPEELLNVAGIAGRIIDLANLQALPATNINEYSQVVLMEGITTIGDATFVMCSNLTSACIPSTVSTLGIGAFAGCSGLVSAQVPEGLTSVSMMAFGACNNLTRINVPASVASIGNMAFYNCTSLKQIDLPERVASIGESAFESCSNLKSISIQKDNCEIGERAFIFCAFKKVEYQASSEGEYTFNNGLLTITSTDPTISTAAWFTDNLNPLITDVDWGTTARTALSVDYAFMASSIENLTVPNTLNNASDFAFAAMINLKTVKYTLIQDGVFEFVNGHLKLTSTDTLPPNWLPKLALKIDFGNYSGELNSTHFAGCNLTEITIPDSITAIGDVTFDGSLQLKKVRIEGNTRIGAGAFVGCPGIERVYISAGVTQIGYRSFLDSSKLKSVEFGNDDGNYKWVLTSQTDSDTLELTKEQLADASQNPKYFNTEQYAKYNWVKQSI